MTWQWVIVVLGLALVYAALFVLALVKVGEIAICWAWSMAYPYEEGDFEPDVEQTAEHDTLVTRKYP
jgi:hypothetical protein